MAALVHRLTKFVSRLKVRLKQILQIKIVHADTLILNRNRYIEFLLTAPRCLYCDEYHTVRVRELDCI